jgi:type II secretory pathway pseudopilin PulG
MRRHRLKSSEGFTLIAAMAAVVIIGIMAGAAAQSWQMRMKREREEELMFRGTQYMSALKRWYNPNLKTPPQNRPSQTLAATNVRPLRDIKDLLWDPNSPNPEPYLRKLYKDPITNKDFVPILDANQSIIGVKSSSEEEPLKKGNFPDELQGLNDKKKYSEWEFVYRAVPIARATGTGATGLPPVPPVPGG